MTFVLLAMLAVLVEPTCHVVDQINENIAVCIQDDGTYFMTYAGADWREGDMNHPVEAAEIWQ